MILSARISFNVEPDGKPVDFVVNFAGDLSTMLFLSVVLDGPCSFAGGVVVVEGPPKSGSSFGCDSGTNVVFGGGFVGFPTSLNDTGRVRGNGLIA